MQSRTFAIDHVLETFVLFKLTLNKGQYQVLIAVWKHKIVKWFLIPLDVVNAINVKEAPAAIAKTEAPDLEVAHHKLIRSELGVYAGTCSLLADSC